MPKVESCQVKPVCEFEDGIRGVEDHCRQESVSFDGKSIPLEYAHLADSCTCDDNAGQKQLQKMCATKPRKHLMFKKEEKAVEPEKVEEKSEEYNFQEVCDSFKDVMWELDDEGMINGFEVKIGDDGNSTMELDFFSEKTGDAHAYIESGDESGGNIWESVGQDLDYLEALAEEALKQLPEGWSAKLEMGDIPLDGEVDSDSPGKRIMMTKDFKAYIKLIPPETLGDI